MAPKNRLPVSIIVIGLFTSLLFLACSQHSDRFSLKGHFKNLNQGEFYIYDLEKGVKDTIAVNDGRFTYVRPMKDTTTLVMLFPNYSELPIFARPGAEVSMEGDASQLRTTEITGTDDNEAMTKFRHATNDKTPPEVQKDAQQFIKEHPASPVSLYLLRRYFLQTTTPDYPLALQLCEILHQKQPQNLQLARLHTLLEQLKNQKSSGALPPFEAVSTKGDTISNKTLKGEANVIAVWAAWSFESQSIFRTLNELTKDHPKKISVVAICLDATPAEGKNFLERDSIQWPNICDGQLWQSPLLTQLGIATLPANIVVDKKGNIVARNINNADLKDKIKEMLEEEKKN